MKKQKKRKNGCIVWKCRCDCGNIVEVRGTSLKNGNTKSCGCKKNIGLINYNNSKNTIQIGNRYGKLIVIKYIGYFFYWSEPDYPNIFFAQDGAMSLYGKSFFVLGGAYSIDKYYRLSKGWKWFEDEQMSLKNRNIFLKWTTSTKSFDYVLSHTAPLSKEPTHLFLANIDQSTVDKSMEEFLEKIKNQIEFKKWFFGHYHSDEIIDDKFRLMYNDIIELDLTK